jgi:hypothetical protein
MAAHSAANKDSSDPFTPTTAGLVVVAGLLISCPLMRQT